MNTTSLSIGIGQAGSQILNELLTLQLDEISSESVADDSQSQISIDPKLSQLSFPAIAIDSESKPISCLPKKNIDVRSLICREKGCGGNYFSGRQFQSESFSAQSTTGIFSSQTVLEATTDAVRFELEKFGTNFSGFSVIHSLGGGTGSGFSSQLLTYLNDNFKTPIKTAIPILPSSFVDTGPMQAYNTILSLSKNLDLVDFLLLFRADSANSEIVKDLLPVLERLFEVKEEIAPLDDFKILTSASVKTAKPIESFKLLETSLEKKYSNLWPNQNCQSNITIPPNFSAKYLKFNAKRDPFLSTNKRNVKNYFENEIKFKDGRLNLNERQFTVYKNSANFVPKLWPILQSCKMKFKKKAYFHHFDEDMLFEIDQGIRKLDEVVLEYKLAK